MSIFTTTPIRESKSEGVFRGRKGSRQRVIEDLSCWMRDFVKYTEEGQDKDTYIPVIYIIGTYRIGKTSVIYHVIDEKIGKDAVCEVYISPDKPLKQCILKLMQNAGLKLDDLGNTDDWLDSLYKINKSPRFSDAVNEIDRLMDTFVKMREVVFKNPVIVILESRGLSDSLKNNVISRLMDLGKVQILVEQTEEENSSNWRSMEPRFGKRWVPEARRILPLQLDETLQLICGKQSSVKTGYPSQRPAYCLNKDEVEDCAICNDAIQTIVSAVGHHPGLLQRVCTKMRNIWEGDLSGEDDNLRLEENRKKYIKYCLSEARRELEEEINGLLKAVQQRDAFYQALIAWAKNLGEPDDGTIRSLEVRALARFDQPAETWHIPTKIAECLGKLLNDQDNSQIEDLKWLTDQYPQIKKDSKKATLKSALRNPDLFTTDDLTILMGDLNYPYRHWVGEGTVVKGVEKFIEQVWTDEKTDDLVQAMRELKQKQ